MLFQLFSRVTALQSLTHADEEPKLLDSIGLDAWTELNDLSWPDQIHELSAQNWVHAYKGFLDADAFAGISDADEIPEQKLGDIDTVPEDDIPYQYYTCFGYPDTVGTTTEIEINELLYSKDKYKPLIDFIQNDSFPLMQEYKTVKQYYEELKKRTEKENESDSLFDD